jgi:hypothetical protein
MTEERLRDAAESRGSQGDHGVQAAPFSQCKFSW